MIRQPHIIYEVTPNENEEQEKTPSIVAELNENLQKDASPNTKDFTVEWIAERAGINKTILYEWAESDAEITTALERLKNIQEDDPFKTGTEEDILVNSMTLALLFLETIDRHHKSQDS